MGPPAAAQRTRPTAGHGSIVGVDIGGTFTDAVVIDTEGRVFFDKAHSTPANPAEGAIAALRNVAAVAGADMEGLLAGCRLFAHGTTVGTNALIERRGASVGLMTTRGFEDTVLIGRGPMGKNMGIPLAQAMDFIHNERPEPLVDAQAIVGIRERIDLDGEVVAALCEPDVRDGVARLRDQGIDSIAICLLWSFRNDAHERRVAELVRQLAPDVNVSLASDIAPQIGEFERSTTTVVNAFVAPVLSRYVDDLAGRLSDAGLRYPPQLMTSSGGVIFPRDLQRNAVRLINGGPVGGLVAAQKLGRAIGCDDVITADMGGTSFDVGVIRRGSIHTDQTVYVSQGTPVAVDAARVVTIGAGGGSIAASDGRRLHVGPRSAGADPGPACYGRGGHEATVTDALVVLGLLNPEQFFGGREHLDPGLAAEAIRAHVAAPLGIAVEEAAAGIYEIVTSRMRDLIRQMTVESGFDTRGFALVAYGGAAPIHAAGFSARLGLREVIVPATSAVFSALGCALSDVRYAHARSLPLRLSAEGSELPTAEAVLDELEGRALSDMEAAGQAASSVMLRRRLDVRYVGQMSEIVIDVERPLTSNGVRLAFEQAYEERYGPGTTRRQSPVEIITYRVDAIAASPHPFTGGTGATLNAGRRTNARVGSAGSRRVYHREGGWADAAILDGSSLQAGMNAEGPALIERGDTTIWVPPGHVVHVDELGNVRMRLPS
jgi:N-methylhydantoinase A